jgi:hypothetical protein
LCSFLWGGGEGEVMDFYKRKVEKLINTKSGMPGIRQNSSDAGELAMNIHLFYVAFLLFLFFFFFNLISPIQRFC